MQVWRNIAAEWGLTAITRPAVMETVSFEGWHLVERRGERNTRRQAGMLFVLS